MPDTDTDVNVTDNADGRRFEARIGDQMLGFAEYRLDGELAQNLRALYDYCVQRLTQANLRNDEAAVVEIVALIEPLAQSWKDIRSQVVKGA